MLVAWLVPLRLDRYGTTTPISGNVPRDVEKGVAALPALSL